MKKISILLLISMFLLLAGCSTQSGSASAASTGKTVLVGTEGTYKPFNYKDESGNLTGYDIAVLKEVDKRTDSLKFDFAAVQWDSLFLGLESKKYDMVADELVKTPEREAKYQFSDNSYFSAKTYIIVRDDDNSVKTLDDLKGKKVGVSVGTLYANILEKYNEANNNAINIAYYEGNVTSIFQDLEEGRVDAAINDKLILNDAVKTLGLKIKVVGDPVDVSKAYFVFPQGTEGDALKSEVDKAITSMKSDGTLAKISTDWFGEDLT